MLSLMGWSVDDIVAMSDDMFKCEDCGEVCEDEGEKYVSMGVCKECFEKVEKAGYFE